MHFNPNSSLASLRAHVSSSFGHSRNENEIRHEKGCDTRHEGRELVRLVKPLHVGKLRLHLAANTEAGNFQKRHEDTGDPFRWFWPTVSRLPSLAARKVRVDELGQVWNVREKK